MPPARANAMDHVVLVLFENRSFDNLLGRLYQPGEVAVLRGRDRQGPEQPDPRVGRARRRAQGRPLRRGDRDGLAEPRPGRGVPAHQHPAVQRARRGQPLQGRHRDGGAVQRPGRAGQVPTMDGFVTDYISFFTVEMGRQPTYDEYRQIMTGLHPRAGARSSAEIARGFGVFDHWFSEVPSQTMTNRSFWTAAHVVGVRGQPADERLHAPQRRRDDLRPARAARQDLEGLRARARPDLLHRDDPHAAPAGPVRHQLRALLPSSSATRRRAPSRTSRSSSRTCWPATATTTRRSGGRCSPESRSRSIRRHRSWPVRRSWPASTTPCRSARSAVGSNVFNTTLFIGWDEPGGTYDHVPPGPVRPPDPSAPLGPLGFRFDRSGYRVPAIIVSPWVPEGVRLHRRVPAHLDDRHPPRGVGPRRAVHRPGRRRPDVSPRAQSRRAAMIASIEGKRGTPRPRPPYPAVSGLWGAPTLINNVETFANVAPIIRHGGEWFSSMGTARSKGTKVFALTGKIQRTGLVDTGICEPDQQQDRFPGLVHMAARTRGGQHRECAPGRSPLKPPPFDYAAPTTLDEAIGLLAKHADAEARVLAGGQSLIPMMNFRLAKPGYLVDLRRVAGLAGIRREGDTLVIGAMTRMAEVERSPEVAVAAPLVTEAIGLVAHVPVRNSGTVGGSNRRCSWICCCIIYSFSVLLLTNARLIAGHQCCASLRFGLRASLTALRSLSVASFIARKQ